MLKMDKLIEKIPINMLSIGIKVLESKCAHCKCYIVYEADIEIDDLFLLIRSRCIKGLNCMVSGNNFS